MTLETQEQMDDRLGLIFFICANILEEIKEGLNQPHLSIPDLPLEMAGLLRSLIRNSRSTHAVIAFIEATALKLVKEWGDHDLNILNEIHDINSLDAFLDFEDEFMTFFKMKERKDKIASIICTA